MATTPAKLPMKVRKRSNSTTFAHHDLCKTKMQGQDSMFQRVQLHKAPPPTHVEKVPRLAPPTGVSCGNAVPPQSETASAPLSVLASLLSSGCLCVAADLLGGVAGALPRCGGDMEPRSGGMRGETSPPKETRPSERKPDEARIRPSEKTETEAERKPIKEQPEAIFGADSYGSFQSASDYWHSFDGEIS